MLDMPSAFSCQAMSSTSSPGCTQAVAGREVEGASKGREEGTGRQLETPPFASSRTTETAPGLQAQNLSQELPRSAGNWKGLMLCFKAVGCQDVWV